MKSSIIEEAQKFASLQKRKFMKRLAAGIFSLFILFFALPVFGQNIHVRGHVTSDANQIVARPSVSVKGTAIGVTGDDNGDFEINAPAKGTLVISAVDFTTQEIKINNRTTINVTLVSLNKSLNEVVVIGYGTTQRKK